MVLHTHSQAEAAELIKAIVFPSAVAKAILFQEGPESIEARNYSASKCAVPKHEGLWQL